MNKKGPLALIIIDGWGLSADNNLADAYKQAPTPYFDQLFAHCPWTKIEATGLAVGLPPGQIGNSEVGHLNIGAGRIVYQDLTRINQALEEGTFQTNPVLESNFLELKKTGGALHLLGLVSDGGVHSHLEHLKSILKLAKEFALEKVYLHAVLDGRDVLPKSALKYIEELEGYIKNLGLGELATIGGRYYYMDRDNRWERIEKAYRAMVDGEGLEVLNAREAILAAYKRGELDEFITPSVIKGKDRRIKKDDLIFFYNYRADRARQMTRAFIEKDFKHFSPSLLAGEINFLTLTQYDKNFNLPVVFPPLELNDHLGEWLSKHQYRQLRLAETEKYAHVTFFFNGGTEEKYPGEERCLVPSPKVATYDLKPEMSAFEVTEKALDYLEKGETDVFIINYANFDMVGHTGDFEAALNAVSALDSCLAKLIPAFLEKEGLVILTADHGNIEKMVDEKGGPFTAHTVNPVPFLICGLKDISLREDGILADLAPTILDLLGLPIPQAMTGKSIILGG